MALPKPLKYLRVVILTLLGVLGFLILIIPTLIFALYLRLSRPSQVPFHSHFFTRILYLAAAMFPYQWYHPAISFRSLLVPGQRCMVVRRDTWTAYWAGTLETKKVPSETRGGKPTWKVSLKGVDVIMLYAHGGGFVFGDAEMYNNIFTSWVKHFEEVHGKKLRILSLDYAGDSSGANIALNAIYALQESGELPMPRAVLCISPWIRLDANEQTSPSMARNRYTDFMPPQVFKKIARTYAGSEQELHDPHVSPFYVKDHSQFPEMAMVYSGSEVLRDDCARFVDLFQKTGGRITYHYMAEGGLPHVYPLLRELSGKTAVKDAERRLMEWVNLIVEENRLTRAMRLANGSGGSVSRSSYEPLHIVLEGHALDPHNQLGIDQQQQWQRPSSEKRASVDQENEKEEPVDLKEVVVDGAQPGDKQEVIEDFVSAVDDEEKLETLVVDDPPKH
ncbi:hypothetical protein DFQ27_005229 [Actinomortierella ambigua]|uniref:Alpha/beta hydrolase fold-3 domain-containing protein n=1 Tax=Actinomortierella ambigua TaxID=1343610 RepID=A0A9P6UCE6_9FUNG|nr:hypothetical protein DFQ27_005229 [Actinomortierella ambigua]